MRRSDRANDMTPTRRALLAAGVATLAVSLVLSIAPVLAAKGGNGGSDSSTGNGNTGTIKITDATTGQQTNDNDPHVCAFWVGFYASEPFETGTWQLLSWAPTGDGSVVASGTYDTSGDGLDQTGTLSPDPGHFRFDWEATGSANPKHKTLWVDDTCATDTTPPSGEEPSPSQDETPPSDEVTPPSDEEPLPSQDDTPPSQDETPPSQDETPPSYEETPPSEDEGGEGDVLAGNGGPPVAANPAPEAEVAAGGASGLPNTTVPVESKGVVAALGVLLMTAGIVGIRRRPLRG